VVHARRIAQLGFAALVLMIGLQFAVWALARLAGRAPAVGRPAGVEGFLPISALMSLRLWLSGHGVQPVHPAGLAILVAVLAMSLVVARSFCSTLCPVGTASELLGRLGRHLVGRNWAPPSWLDVPLRLLKWLLLGGFMWATWVAMDMQSVEAFLDSPYNRVADVKMLLFFVHPSRLTIGVLASLAVGSLFVRDLWCRYLCPYGALLGLVGRIAPFKLTRDPAVCTDCHRCTKVCPARLSVHTMTRVASVECTSCQDCVAACPVPACLAIRLPHRGQTRTGLRPTIAVVLGVAAYLAVVAGFRVAGHWRTSISEDEYARRLPAIESPLYTHVGGLAARETTVPSAGGPAAGAVAIR
jgi:polyferredoxin